MVVRRSGGNSDTRGAYALPRAGVRVAGDGINDRWSPIPPVCLPERNAVREVAAYPRFTSLPPEESVIHKSPARYVIGI